MYKTGKLLVTTGRLTDKGQHTEVIDLANPDSKCDPLPDYPIQIFGATGGLLQDTSPIVCGGFDGSDLGRISQCYIIDGNETLQTIDLNIYRWNSASVLLDKNTLWITGGYEFESVLYSTEFVKLDQSTAIAGPDLVIFSFSLFSFSLFFIFFLLLNFCLFFLFFNFLF